MDDGTRPTEFGHPVGPSVALPSREDCLRGLLLLLRVSAAGAIVAAVVAFPHHLSYLWQLALASAGDDPDSATTEFLLYLGVVRQDPTAWHAACVVLNGVVAGLLLRLASREGPLSNILPALGMGVFGAVVGEWACGQFGVVLPVAVTIYTVSVAFLSATSAVIVAWLISRF